jgi:hypothetical protein
MRRLSVRHSREPGSLAATLAGLTLGFAAGFLLRGVVGGVDRRRLQTLREEVTGNFPAGRPLARAAVAAVQHALAREPALEGIAFTVVAAGRGRMELHGWVPSRAMRARAIRVAVAAAPGFEVTNRLSVRGEDDLEPAQPPDALLPA